MKIYSVGGAVRDELLGIAVQDRDYVVVGATVEQMLAAGYKPVGADFPVFLHPTTHEEYALARTERKTAPGYKGFVFHTSNNTTLEQDLQRRDLTINAMAREVTSNKLGNNKPGHLIDPFSGQADLNHKLLRHVSEAFSEDPVRVLRVARFAARFAALGFTVAAETMALMQTMVQNGEIDHLVPERVWQELSRGLMEASPATMFEILRQCGALQRLLPELDRLFDVEYSMLRSVKFVREKNAGVHAMKMLQATAENNAPLPIRFAVLTQSLEVETGDDTKNIELLNALCERLRVPGECRDLALATAKWHAQINTSKSLDAQKLLSLLDGTDAMRRPARFMQILDTCLHAESCSSEAPQLAYPPHNYLCGALARLQSLNQRLIAQSVEPHKIVDAIHHAKLDALTQFIVEHRMMS